jgi:ferric-dicitrate binding protein FerR (iron transport regulator)
MLNMNPNAHNQNIDDLIIAYFSEGLDEQSILKLREWVDESDVHRDEFLRQQEIWFSSVSAKDAHEYDVENAKKIFKDRVSQAKKASGISQKHKRGYSRIWKFAIAAAIACVIAFMSYWRGEEDVKSNFADIVVEAPLGAKTKLYLPDGTLVWLNAGSKMSYSQGFGVDDRAVSIDGEGYFEVAKNESLPFTVKSSALKVKVLGTKFNFRDYSDDAQATVSLLEGKVALENLVNYGARLTLSPDQKACLDKKTGKLFLKSSPALNSDSWTNDVIFLDEEPLPEIIRILERSYNTKIVISNDKLKDLRFYGYFLSTDQSLEEVLHALSSTGKFKYLIQNDTATIY